MTSYVDTHCHLDLLDDPIGALDAAAETVVVAVTELPSHFRLLTVRFRKDRRVRVALGLHPLRASSAGAIQESLLLRHLSASDYIGEVGLDYSAQGRSSKPAQIRVFERLLAEPSVRHKVVSVHSRGAERDVIDRLRDAHIPAILHWYTGSPRYIDDALAGGMYFSINPSMLRSKKGIALLADVPPDRVLTETDAPFSKTGSRPAVPHDIRELVADLARHWGVAEADAQRLVHNNLARLYAATVGSSRVATD